MLTVHKLDGHLYICFCDVTIQIFCSFLKSGLLLKLLLRNKIFLYVLDSGNIFSQSATCRFIAYCNLLKSKSSNIIRVSLLKFSFISHYFCVLSRKCLPTTTLQRFSFMFSSKNFIILAFIFKAMVHLEIFTCVHILWRKSYDWILFTWISSWSSTFLKKTMLFILGNPWYLWQKSVYHIGVDLFLDSLFLFFIPFFLCQYHSVFGFMHACTLSCFSRVQLHTTL